MLVWVKITQFISLIKGKVKFKKSKLNRTFVSVILAKNINNLNYLYQYNEILRSSKN